ncbi:MAG: nucleoside triphosphate pyrophosphohydrolase [Gammaproteobacteria bacterium]|nr:nucleoside triphosphate pyrophosphohydrolase [Gammaproteobacteria bacterium]
MINIDHLLAIMARLRDPVAGCPWDREQTFNSLVPHTLEEAYEVADAIARGDTGELRSELGDLLFQVVFYAQIAREAGQFDFNDIVAAISDKLIRRHPHVFGEAKIASATDQSRAWEEHKAAERAMRAREEQRPPSILDGVTHALPALTRAAKLQNRAARVGFDWPDIRQVMNKIEEETAEIHAEIAQGAPIERMEDEIGDLLFVAVNLARHAGIDAESAVRRANTKFERRFRRIETLLAESGRTPEQATLEEMDALWDRAKEEEKA